MSVMLYDVDPGIVGRAKLLLLSRIKFRHVHLGTGYGWTYLFRCSRCGKIVESYEHGYSNRLDCPRCDLIEQ